MAEKDAAYYRRLPYTRRTEPIMEEGRAYWLASIAELPSIEMHGDTREEALALLDEVFDDCIGAMLEAGDDIPEPVLWPQPYRAIKLPPARRRRHRVRWSVEGVLRYEPAGIIHDPDIKPFQVAEADQSVTVGA